MYNSNTVLWINDRRFYVCFLDLPFLQIMAVIQTDLTLYLTIQTAVFSYKYWYLLVRLYFFLLKRQRLYGKKFNTMSKGSDCIRLGICEKEEDPKKMGCTKTNGKGKTLEKGAKEMPVQLFDTKQIQ